jgi:hypothetical protein
MGDFGDDFDMDDLIEEDAGFGGGDADEEEMMNLMESTQTTTGATGATVAGGRACRAATKYGKKLRDRGFFEF